MSRVYRKYWCVLPDLRITWAELTGHQTARLIEPAPWTWADWQHVSDGNDPIARPVQYIILEQLLMFCDEGVPGEHPFYSAVPERELTAAVVDELVRLLTKDYWPATLQWPQRS